jgi:hypothetical protein
VGKVDLRLLARHGLEAHLKGRHQRRPHLAQKVGHRGIAAGITKLSDLAQQAGCR